VNEDREGSMQDRLRAVTVGSPARLDGPIVLEDYNEDWRAWFDEEASALRSILGDRVLSLEHVGSTSVPGLCAKPVIDMVLVVRDSSDENAYIAPLQAHGYTLRIREPDWHQHRVLKGPQHNINLHVFSEGCAEVVRMVSFRDWLRRNPEDRDHYEKAKRDLARRSWGYVQEYADAKSEVVEAIIARAMATRQATD